VNWMHAIAELPVWLTAGFVVGISLPAAWALCRLAWACTPFWHQPGSNEIVGYAYGVFGMMYGVLLAFTIVGAWERFVEAERIVVHEVTMLGELWRDVKAFPPDVADGFHRDLIAYSQSLIEDEWPAMADRGQRSPKTQRIYEGLWERTYRLEPQTKLQEAFLAEILADINQLSATRRLRVLHSRKEINGILWLVLFVGAVPTIGYTLMFANGNRAVQVLVTASIILIVLLGILVAMELQYPFTGEISIRPDAVADLLESFRQRLGPVR
jgi:hypothetical protein